MVVLHAVRVELVRLVRDGLTQLLADLLALRAGGLAQRQLPVQLAHVGGVVHVERGDDAAGVGDALVGPLHDLAGDRRPLGVVGLQQRRRGEPGQHVVQLPGQVVGVLDRGVGAEPVGRRVPVDRVADAEDPPVREGRGEVMVHRPRQPGGDPHLEVVGADQLHGQLAGELVGDLGWPGRGLVAPHEHPLVPRLDHPQHAQPHALLLGARLHHPVQDRRPVLDEAAQVGLEDDVQRPAHRARALEREVQVGRDLAPGTVRADHVLRADRVGRAGEAVQDLGGHPGLVLDVGQVLGVEPHLGPAGLRRLHHDRLGDGLRGVQHRAGALQLVVVMAPRVGAPGRDPAQLVAGQAGAERGVAHPFPGRGLAHEPLLQAHVAQRLHGPLVRDVRAGGVGQVPVLRDHHGRCAVRGQEQRGGRAARPRPDHEDIGLYRSCVAAGDGTAHGTAPG